MRENSARKRLALAKRRKWRLPEDPIRAAISKCPEIERLKSLPPLPEPPFVEQDDRRQRVIRSELARLEPSGGFHDPLPLPRTGIF